MKMHYAELKNRPRLLKSLIGLNTTEFEALLPSFLSVLRQLRNSKGRVAARRLVFVPTLFPVMSIHQINPL